MSYQHRSDHGGIEELRKLLPAESSIRPRDDGYEITIQSAIDEALTFFVSFPKKHLDAPRPPTTTGEPVEPD